MSLGFVASQPGNVIAVPLPVPLHCVGNLIINGGFERGFLGWKHTRASIVQDPYAHAGRRAAGLGTRRRSHARGTLQQLVVLPQRPGWRFHISFHVAGRSRNPAHLWTAATWQDAHGHPLALALRARTPKYAIGAARLGQWTYYSFITNEMPQEARTLNLQFIKSPGRSRNNFLVIDDVHVLAVPPACLQGNGPTEE